MLLALIPALIVIPQPDLGTALVYVAVGFAILFFAGTSWKQLTALAALFVAAIVLVLVVAPALGAPPAQALPDAAPDRLPASVARSRRTRPTTSPSR